MQHLFKGKFYNVSQKLFTETATAYKTPLRCFHCFNPFQLYTSTVLYTGGGREGGGGDSESQDSLLITSHLVPIHPSRILMCGSSTKLHCSYISEQLTVTKVTPHPPGRPDYIVSLLGINHNPAVLKLATGERVKH